MKHEIRTIPALGRVLWMTDGQTEVGAALDFGIRVVHLSLAGMENLFYRQPADLSDGFVTADGWRLWGGHRFWLSPESEDTYAPDNEPVAWTLLDHGVTLTQQPDLRLGVQKSLTLEFLEDGTVRLLHQLRNLRDQPITCALWGVNTLAPGGAAMVDFTADPPGSTVPGRVVSLWGQTSLGDPRITFEKDRLLARHTPSEDYFKIGLFSKGGIMVLENLGQRLTIGCEARSPELYSDLGCNLELYLNRHFMELETLGIRHNLQPGETASHTETWRLQRL